MRQGFCGAIANSRGHACADLTTVVVTLVQSDVVRLRI